MNKNQTIPKAFTIIELLVVVTIISVLMALLLPSLSKAREAAMLTKCSTQTRSIALATAAYACDNRNLIPPHIGITPTTGNSFQGTKNPGGYWWYRVGGGLQRAGLLWPNYITNSESFYCPTTTGYSDNPTYQHYHFDWAKAAIGTTSGPIASITSYAYPAVEQENTRNNFGGDWTGIPNQYWSGFNAYSAYTYWSLSMVKQTLDANPSTTPIAWDLDQGNLTMHDGQKATIAFVDGSAIQFPHVEYLKSKLVWVYGNGMDNPNILPTLRTYRETGEIP